MEWVEGIGRAIGYIEENITGELTAEKIAAQAFVSPFYFQKGFAMLCGFSLGEYIRRRRLSLAGGELAGGGGRVIDIALKYGYESPDSFTRAFTRFRGVTPTAVRKEGAMVRAFAPLKIKFLLEGGSMMEYKIVDKPAFTVLGAAKTLHYGEAAREVPRFWEEHFATGRDALVCGMYGVNIDEAMGGETFEYLIADDCAPGKEAPQGLTVRRIPAYTWAVFPCRGPMPAAMQRVQQGDLSEWLPSCRDYEIAAGYNIEAYNDPAQYPDGQRDEGYYSEVWVPVRKKA